MKLVTFKTQTASRQKKLEDEGIIMKYKIVYKER